MTAAASGREIAIVGMSGRFPGAGDLRQFWHNLRDGREAVTFLAAAELAGAGAELLADPHYVRAASLLDGVELFDAPFFGYSAREAEILDPQQRLFLEHAWETLEDAGYCPARFDGLIGVYAGVAWNTYLLSNLTSHPELFADGGFQVFIASDKDFLPTRVSYKLNLRGPSMVVQTSCSTSLVAVHLACLSLLNYECDLALAGGVTVKVPQRQGYLHQEGSLASPDGHCRAFDAQAAGTIFGSGIGVVALKRLAEALADGDSIRAVIKGSAINNDGSLKVSYTAPSVEGQAEVIAAAQAIAGVDPESIGHVEAHGTGTSLGDPIEIAALTKVFREATAARGFCAVGSVKTNVGHLDAAAGVAGLIKTVLALEHRQLPPSLNFERPNPAIDFAGSPFYVNAELREWPAAPGAAGTPRRAAVSSFGVGGTNAHLIVEEAPRAAASPAQRPWQLLLLSARSEAALEAATDHLADHLADRPQMDDGGLADVAFTLHAGRSVFRRRRALVARNATAAAAALRRRDPAWLVDAADAEDPRERPVAFMFPGLGAQHVDMGRALYEREAVFRAALDRCCELLSPALGRDPRPVLYPAADAPRPAREEARRELAAAALAWPALFAVEHALAELWTSWGVRPAAVIGEGPGEYVAACLAGAMPLADALALAVARGRLAQGLEPGAAAFAAAAQRVRLAAPKVPIVSSLSGAWITPGEATDAAWWARGANQQARLDDGLGELLADPRRILLEVGPGHALATLAGRHPRHEGQPVVVSLPAPGERPGNGPAGTAARAGRRQDAEMDERDERDEANEANEGDAQAAMIGALGRLWLAGLRLDDAGAADGPLGGKGRRRVPLPTYPFERQRYWIEPAASASPAAAGAAAAGAETAASLAKRQDLADWFYLPSWRLLAPAAAVPAAGPPPLRWLLLTTAAGLAERWAARLAREGREVVTAVPGERFERLAGGAYVVPPADAAGYRALLDELRATGGAPEVVVHAWTLPAEAGGEGQRATDAAAFEAAQEAGFHSLLLLARELTRPAGEEAPASVIVLSSELARLHAGEPLRPEKAPLLGLCRVLPQEHPRLACRACDLVPPPAGSHLEGLLLSRLTAETDAMQAAHAAAAKGAGKEGANAAAAGKEAANAATAEKAAANAAAAEKAAANAAAAGKAAADAAVELAAEAAAEELVAYRGAQAFVPSYQPLRLPDSAATPLRREGVYLLTGGLEGNGYAIASFLARTLQARLALIETPDPPPSPREGERAARLDALRRLGAEVVIEPADLADEAAVALAVVAAEARLGPLHGVVHAAGTAGERTFRLLRELGREECAWHFVPKVHGLLALDKALAGRQLDFCLALSSLGAVLGGVAYGAYAAANLFVDAFVAERQRHPGPGEVSWVALDWDLWAFEHEPEQITGVRHELAGLAMSPREGEEALRRALAALSPGVERLLVSTAGLAGRVAERRRRTASLGRQPAAPGSVPALHPRPLDTPYVAPESDLEKRIAEVWQRTLGFASIGVHDNFFELGGDSFVAIQVVSRLNAELGVELPVAKLYQGLTVRTLAALLAQDEAAATAGWAAQLEERRQSMSRRKELLERRRSNPALQQR